MTEIVIFGTGGHAKVVFDILLKQNIYKPVGFYSLDEKLSNFMGLPHFHQSTFKNSNHSFGIVAIGDNFIRSQVVDFILTQKSKFHFATAIHPSAQVAQDVEIASGTVVMANVSINTASRIGSHSIINTSSSLDHDNFTGNFASIAPGVVTGGNVKISDYTAVSIGSVIKHGIQIGAHTVIGAGSLVLESIGDYKVAYGSPCKVVRERKAGESYL